MASHHNPQDLYDAGQCCKHCNSVLHFARDCPELQFQRANSKIELGMMDVGASADGMVGDDAPEADDEAEMDETPGKADVSGATSAAARGGVFSSGGGGGGGNDGGGGGGGGEHVVNVGRATTIGRRGGGGPAVGGMRTAPPKGASYLTAAVRRPAAAGKSRTVFF